MKKALIIFFSFAIIISLIYSSALFNFFVQDDFILINYFSQNDLRQDLINVFGPPQVTHWRPLHNIYFFLAGNLFGKNYVGYHALTLIFHISASFLIYKIVYILLKRRIASLTAGVFYGIHPAHFVSMFWIAGGATVIGFCLLAASFYSYLIKKYKQSIVLFVLSLLASEAMIVGLMVFAASEFLLRRREINRQFLAIIAGISAVFLTIRVAIFTPKITFDVYPIELSTKVFGAVKYYLLRIAGFAESSGDKFLTILLLAWLFAIAILLIKTLAKDKKNINYMVFSFLIFISGLFPFILIPSHLSPHYMNVSIWGFSLLPSIALKPLKPLFSLMAVLAFVAIAMANITLTENYSWVIKRGNIAKEYLHDIEKQNLPEGSILVFGETTISTSEESYIPLGTGEAIKFWFKDKNYKTCFTRFEKCSSLP